MFIELSVYLKLKNLGCKSMQMLLIIYDKCHYFFDKSMIFVNELILDLFFLM